MTPIRLLVIEDYVDHIDIFRQTLLLQADYEFDITFATSLREADEKLEALPFDAVVLDINLPDSRGWDTVEHVIAKIPTIPVILHTATSDKDFAARALGAGMQDFIVKGEYTPQLLSRLIRHAIERHHLLVQVNDAKRREHEIAVHDQLTGLLNRASMDEVLSTCLAHARRNGERIAILYIDLDRFKNVNDGDGHVVGDAVLVETARRIKSRLRDSDYVFRIGGDEFLCVLRDVKRSADIDATANAVVAIVNEPVQYGGREYFVGASVGVSIYPDDGIGIEQLLQYADAAMYAAKGDGRNQHRYYDSTLKSNALWRSTQERELRQALVRGEIEVHYQPIVDSATGQIAACEALARWHHPERGSLTADAFIHVAEESGIIFDLDEYVLRSVVDQYGKWRRAGVRAPRVHVNVSAKNFVRPDYLKRVESIVACSSYPPDWLEIELTESSLMDISETSLRHVKQLQARGVRVSIDDFGMGYSSLHRLKSHPVNSLKIDKSFIADLVKSESDQAIVRAIIALARCMALEVVAEGVETIEQVQLLNEFNCHLMQGYYYGRPMGHAHLSATLARRSTRYLDLVH